MTDKSRPTLDKITAILAQLEEIIVDNVKYHGAYDGELKNKRRFLLRTIQAYGGE